MRRLKGYFKLMLYLIRVGFNKNIYLMILVGACMSLNLYNTYLDKTLEKLPAFVVSATDQCIMNAEDFLEAFYSQSPDYFQSVKNITEPRIYQKALSGIKDTNAKKIQIYILSTDISSYESDSYSYEAIIKYYFTIKDTTYMYESLFRFSNTYKINKFECNPLYTY